MPARLCCRRHRRRYEGGFVAGLRDGHGTQRYVDGSVYTGSWFRDRRHGQGTLTHANGDKYTGESPADAGMCARSGARAMRGRATPHHAGAWAHDKKNGPGKYAYISRRRVYTGEWLDDVAKCGEMAELPAGSALAGAGGAAGLAASASATSSTGFAGGLLASSSSMLSGGFGAATTRHNDTLHPATQARSTAFALAL